ncbi:4-hydroxythreonine-4-phosphate dehydrogenase PdxA [Eilatimonas milleporae]|uniref:4-hydroxythreonine-4-phosphate dehydrogenase n=1 Tax=Eilatimonas milleporae TaxID=911205 RepID=A0A3M0CP63_9PROT|nr:4-hydroxythreonine-4-phosphate dehydrogenase PdxA [Eilatimonas milleporae]RMB08586.1 4-hydroxythreonine-4-phosphate dehydrogenase [Eilatimonas milleporae]
MSVDRNTTAETASPPVALTMGEPAGVGPSLIARLWLSRDKHALPPFFGIGSRTAFLAHVADLPVRDIAHPAETAAAFDSGLPLLPVDMAGPVTPGAISADTAAGVIAALDMAVSLALSGDAGAIVTAPIQKSALYGAGFKAAGHTDYLAQRCGLPAETAVMMLACDGLRVVPVTVHIPLKEVARQLTPDAIVRAAHATHEALKTRFGIAAPRLAVAGLNPHAGEDGALGLEEGTHILPALRLLRDHGMDISGPFPADTMFHAEARNSFDAALCMYHDQALIPLKTLDFWGGVNVTLGLPIVRTSPDHGTALDLVADGKTHEARLDSMLAAFRMAVSLSQGRISAPAAGDMSDGHSRTEPAS